MELPDIPTRPIEVKERLCSRGGAPCITIPWVSREINVLDNDKNYIALRGADPNLIRCVGLSKSRTRRPLQSNLFLESLRKQRDKAVDDMLLSHMKKSDPFLQTLPRNARSLVDPADVPNHVSLDMCEVSAAHDGLRAGPTVIDVATELDRKRMCYVFASAAALHYIRVA